MSMDMDIMEALELTLRTSHAHGGLTRGIHESAKLIERNAAQLCVLADDCNQPDYVKLVKSLCADHNISVLTVPSAETLGGWAGVGGASCVVVKDYGEESMAFNILQRHLKSQ